MEWSFARMGRLAATMLVIALTVASGAAAVPERAQATERTTATSAVTEQNWARPVRPFHIARPFVAPADDYGPGHRGIDVDIAAGAEISAPAAGIVAFSGLVAGRGVLTIDHGDGLVSTLEPVQSALRPGTAVGKGEHIGAVSFGGHVPPGQLHFGARLNGAYINPMLLLGEVPRAILLPCCD